jgi:hypothetical protein
VKLAPRLSTRLNHWPTSLLISAGHSITPTQASQIAALANIGDQTLSASPNGPNNAIFANAVQAAMTDIEYGSTSDGGAAVNAETANLLTLAQGLTPNAASWLQRGDFGEPECSAAYYSGCPRTRLHLPTRRWTCWPDHPPSRLVLEEVQSTRMNESESVRV